LTLGEARSRFARVLRLSMNGTTATDDARKLQALLAPYRGSGIGGCPVRLIYRNGAAQAEIPLPESWRVRLEDSLLAALNAWLKVDNVKVVYA
jgi:DNA polymerase-3 subunit alpha